MNRVGRKRRGICLYTTQKTFLASCNGDGICRDPLFIGRWLVNVWAALLLASRHVHGVCNGWKAGHQMGARRYCTLPVRAPSYSTVFTSSLRTGSKLTLRLEVSLSANLPLHHPDLKSAFAIEVAFSPIICMPCKARPRLNAVCEVYEHRESATADRTAPPELQAYAKQAFLDAA